MLVKIGNFGLLFVLWLAIIQDASAPVLVEQSMNWTLIIVAGISAIPASVAAIVTLLTLLQSRQNAKVASATEAVLKQNVAQTGVIIDKTTEIHTLTNSNLSKVQSQLDVAREKIDGFSKAHAESARKLANMELLITSLIPAKGEQSPSQANSVKLDNLTSMLGDVQHGTPPIPVKDDAVLAKLSENDQKLDIIKETVEHPEADKKK